jgi:Tol biopolymer transport system component
MLWLRRLDSSSGQFLPGTEGVIFSPSWSVDGRSILFIDSGGNLKSLDVSSAASPQLIAGTGPAWGADWNRDKVILVGQTDRGIVRTSPLGGEPSPITHLDASHQEIAHYLPRFLPDGRNFLYLARSKNAAEHAICVASLDGRVQKRLLVNPSLAQYAPAYDRRGGGFLLYVRGTALVAHRFNADTLAISGDPRPIAEDVANGPYGTSLFSASRNGVLAYRTEIGGTSQLAWFDRTGKPLGTVGAPGLYGNPVISPDGRRVAFDLVESSYNQDIWTLDLAGGHLSRLTFDPEVDHGPTWSPDGRRIVFDSHRSGLGGLYVKAATGAASEELLLSWKDFSSSLDWARDGRFILFQSWGPDRRGDLWVLPLTGSRKPFPYLRTAADESGGTFSPDGKWIAYVSNESGTPRIYVQAFDGVSPAGGGKWQIGDGTQPIWSANGKELFYLTADYTLMAAEIRPGDTFATGARRALFATRLAHLGPRNDYGVSPNGLRFLMRVLAEKPRVSPIQLIVNWTD